MKRAAIAILATVGAGAAARADTVHVPTQLSVTRVDDALDIGVSPDARKAVAVRVSPGAILGVASSLRVYPVGSTPSEGSSGLASGTDFEIGTSRVDAPRGPRYTVELELAVFETSVPPQHHWLPRAAGYHVLWSRTLRAVVN